MLFPDSPEPVAKTIDLIDLTESDDEDVTEVLRSSPTSSASSSVVIATGSPQSFPPRLEPSLQSMVSDQQRGFSGFVLERSFTPPVLRHFLDLDPWNSYFSSVGSGMITGFCITKNITSVSISSVHDILLRMSGALFRLLQLLTTHFNSILYNR